MRKVEDDATQKRWLLDGERLSSRMRDSWQSGDFWIMYAARNNFASDAIYWKKIDRRFFGSTLDEEDNVRDARRQRLDLLEPEETKLMEEYVDLKLKELNTPVFAWDKDEYTLEWIQKMRAVRKIKEAKEKMESLVLEWDDDLEKTMEMERKGEFEKSKVVNMINEMREEMERMEIQWKVDIKDIKGMEMKEEILDMKKRKTRKEAEWDKEIKRMEMESKAETDFPKALVRFALAFFFYLFNYRDNCKYSVSQSISPRDTVCFRGLYDKE